ncbi:probable peptidoglycan muropeptide transporter SLC46 [Planococcus citri]|uniref:probable peptidoglycan muropeptide transporter SLC46 n=1 Tax=Planococcus citri TaxID=170843 RepID=UPI0031F8DD32
MGKNFNRFVKVITVEPAYFFYWSTYVIADSAYTNLLLQKKCRVSTLAEPDLNTPCDDEKQGVVFATEMNSFYRMVMLLLALIVAIFMSSWSDEAGKRRRPLIFLPIIGLIFQSIFGCLHSYFWSWIPTSAVLLNSIPEVITGGISMMIMATQIYICDVSSLENCTLRMGILLATRTLADLFGCGSSGFILHSFGFFYTYLLCFVLSVISLILACIFVKDVSVPVSKKSNFIKSFNVTKIVDSFKVVFSKKLGKNRIVVVMLMITYTLVFFTTQGEKGILYLFLRHKFHWNEREYSIYVLYRYTGVIVGNLFCSVVMSKLLKLHDGMIGIIAGIFDTIAAFGYLFASQDWHLYVVPLFDVFHGAALTVCICFLSKYYESHEIGRLTSVLGVFALINPSCHPTYNGIFEYALDVFPSAHFLLSVSLDLIIVLLYCASYSFSQKFKISKSFTKEEIKIIH